MKFNLLLLKKLILFFFHNQKKVHFSFHPFFWWNYYIEIHIQFYQLRYLVNFFYTVYRNFELLVDLFHIVFCILYFCIIISQNSLSLIVSPHKIAVDIGITIKPITVRDNLIELDVTPIMTIVSNDFNFVVNDLYFLYIFLELLVLSLM